MAMNDQATELKMLMQEYGKSNRGAPGHKTRIIAITSGKGGVGKSIITTIIGKNLAKIGKKVVLIDADLGLKNLKIFTVYTKKYADKYSVPINCGKNRCIDCRRCYTKNKTPVFIAELLK